MALPDLKLEASHKASAADTALGAFAAGGAVLPRMCSRHILGLKDCQVRLTTAFNSHRTVVQLRFPGKSHFGILLWQL